MSIKRNRSHVEREVGLDRSVLRLPRREETGAVKSVHGFNSGTTNQRTKYCLLAISQKKADLSASSTTRNEPRSKRSALSSRSAERAAPLWTARRKRIAARRRSACRSRFAALDMVRRRSTASAPTLRAVSLCHACRLRRRRIRITRNRPGLGETGAPQKMVRGERKQGRPGLRQAGAKGETRWTHV